MLGKQIDVPTDFGPAAVAAGDSGRRRSAGAFDSPKAARRFWITVAVLVVASAVSTLGLLSYGNPMPFGSSRFWLIAERRADAVIAMAVVALCQATATVAFQTVTNNKIITPGVMGFQSLYAALHTGTVYFFGVTGLLNARSFTMFLVQIALMVGFSLVLYSWLLTGKHANMHVMLLVGIVIGGGLGSVSTFMQRMLTPSEFDILTARLFGSVNNADSDYYPVALPLVFGACAVLFLLARKLNVIGLGRDVAENLGVNYKQVSITVLVMVSILTAVSTALVGPMVFLGFLVAMLTYQFANTYDHKYLLPLSALLAYMVLTVAYFLMYHVFEAQGVVSIIIELVGAVVFLFVILRKGSL
ncbi:iron chelate uptake ABC transporter family permease subunit [Rothia aerolata]|uniref:ABC-type cobalamin/Fe3+-siderophore transport system, permease n=1 Tax=Rothia aerolata TaxID=1812262 RepID=A0A917ILU6_9MICC|nr:iron chelate uptake ABC transporter family permease subunit [Rothia aerolata]GGH58310.1 ABC-type cobalamin/Fe3+-siderophore transport system, permease [Rothia aerolata]